MTSRKVCATCGLPVRYDEATGEFYHIVGDDQVSRQLETIARNVRDEQGEVSL
jgi:hypothetical protein